MRAVMDEVDIDARAAHGTTIRMVRRPRAVPAPVQRTPPEAEGAVRVTIDDGDPTHPLAVILGDIDAAGAAAVGERVRRVCPSDVHLRLDLAGVGYLDSSGVRLLAELAARQAAGGGDVTVRAPAGGPVRRVLVLTGLEDAMALTIEET